MCADSRRHVSGVVAEKVHHLATRGKRVQCRRGRGAHVVRMHPAPHVDALSDLTREERMRAVDADGHTGSARGVGVCVCVCVCERERERETDVCVCVCVCVCDFCI